MGFRNADFDYEVVNKGSLRFSFVDQYGKKAHR